MFNFGRQNTSLIAKWWRNVDKEILISFIFLFFLGLFFSFSSTSSVIAEKMNKQTYFFFIKHFFFVSVSLFLIVAISIQDRRTLMKFLPYLFFISLLLLSLVPVFGIEVKGSKRWMDFPFLPRFQPVEFVKPMFAIFIAKIITLNEKNSIYKRYLYTFALLSVIILFLINQPDLGQTLLLASTWVTMIFVSGFNMFFLLILIFGFLTIFGLLIFFFQKNLAMFFIE